MNSMQQVETGSTDVQASGTPTPTWLDIEAALTIEPAPLDFVLPGLAAGSVGAIVGAGAAGKTMLALAIASSISCGADPLSLFGLASRPPTVGRVIYLSGEDPEEILAARLHEIGKHFSASHREAITERLRIASMIGHGARIDSQRWRKWLERQADGARIVIIDTLRRFHAQDENDGAAMAALLSNLENVCRATGACIVFLHHIGKASALNGTSGEQQASRGSSVLSDNIRWQANLCGMSEREARRAGVPDAMRRNFVRLGFPKINYGPPISDLWLQRGAGGVLLPASAVAEVLAESQPKPSRSLQARAGAKPSSSIAKTRSRHRTKSEQLVTEVAHGLEF